MFLSQWDDSFSEYHSSGAAFYGDHEHHRASFELFLRYPKEDVCTGAHTLAETYSVLTGMPGKNRIRPDEAMLFLTDVRERLTVFALTASEYFQLIQDAAMLGVNGGGIYDAILARCALKANAETLYTWNIAHFTRLGTKVALTVRLPV